jgi:hypothetical protein
MMGSERENTLRPLFNMTGLLGDKHRAFRFIEYLMGHTA